MKAKNLILVFWVVLFAVSTTAYSDDEITEERPYMGVLLDPAPLPDLLVKHLGLLPNQGIRIKNIHRDSPADKAGLERDDIIISFQGKNVKEVDEFIDAVRNASVGKEVSLEIIHLGKHKTIKLKLAPFKDKIDWKYPPEPDFIQSWWPGKIFRLKPGEKEWMEVVKPDIEAGIKDFVKELYTFYHSADGESYTVTIEGNPNDDNTMITVQVDDIEHKATVRQIHKLPEKYQDAVKEDLERARKSHRQQRRFGAVGTFPLPSPGAPKDLRPYQEMLKRHPQLETLPYRYYYPAPPVIPPQTEKLPHYYSPPPAVPDKQMFDRIEKQLRELQKRLDKLEKRQQEMLERLPGAPKKEKLKT